MASPTSTLLAASTTIATALPSCTTAVPGKHGSVPQGACNSNYAYSPSFAAAIAFSTLFGICFVAQIVEAIAFRKGFCWVMIMGCGWELGSFITRALGSQDQQKLSFAFINQILFLLAPLWINAYAYMTAGRLIYTFHPSKKISKIKAISIGKYFVWLDILSFLIQGAGGTMLSPGSSQSAQKLGKNIYMTGVGIQELFIILFTGLIVRFHVELARLEKFGPSTPKPGKWRWLTYALYAVLVLITVRIIFRLVEFSAGIDPEKNPLPFHEGYALGLDAIPMLLAVIILTVIHPGMVLRGPESEFPSRKERKVEKKATKAEKKMRREERKATKKGLGQDNTYARLQDSSDQVVMENVELGNMKANRSRHENRYFGH